MRIKEHLKSRRIITDGAMGTYFESKYPREEQMAEMQNLTHPDRIRDIHIEYIEAGATLIRTNTFAANSLFLDDEVMINRIVRSGYEIAEQAVRESGKDVFIAADIGPIHDAGYLGRDVILQEYKMICDTFLAAGAQIFLFETQSEFIYLEEITSYLKQKKDVFIWTQFSFDQTGYTRLGLSIRKMIQKASSLDTIDAFGLNCGMEAAHMYQQLEKTDFLNNKYCSALPNAGYPIGLRAKTVYSGSRSYFIDKMSDIAQLGIEILGGCCGTTPDYIRELSAVTDKMEIPAKKTVGVDQTTGSKQNTKLIRKMEAGHKTLIVELDPPFEVDITKILEGAKQLKECGADLLTLSDSPLGRTRMDAGYLAARIQRETGIPVMPHISCRDKNVIGMRAGLLGMYCEQIRNALIVTGDPVGRESAGQIKPVFDFNSIRLMEYISQMNEELFREDPVSLGGALNYHGSNPEAVIKRMEQKIQAGCSFFLTQPIYSKEDIERIQYIKKRVQTRIMCGIMPLVSYKNANFMNSVMPGIHIPETILSRYHENMSRSEGEETAAAISLELIAELEDVADGYYFMTPFNRASLIAGIIGELKGRQNGSIGI
ncbi:MAG: bifunctional homocysteine S-methyltransferase/methylenetetrahydrofolate reductase [Lachnospiraceae bacterium]